MTRYLLVLLFAATSCGNCMSTPVYESCGASQICGTDPPELVMDTSVVLDAQGKATVSGANVGKGALHIEQIRVTGDGLEVGAVDLPLELALDETFSFEVSGTGAGEVLVYTNDPDFDRGIAHVAVTAE